VGTEIELKLATSKRGLHQAMALPWLKKQASEGSRKQELTSVYFDTDDFALREHGVSLRVRKVGGQRTTCAPGLERHDGAALDYLICVANE
jgi:inorganic triphosphatase YgiF